MAAIPITHIEASMACAALRDLPNPLVSTASPITASGISRMQTRHSAVVISEVNGDGCAINVHLRVLGYWREKRARDPVTRSRIQLAQRAHEGLARSAFRARRERATSLP